MLPCDFFAFTFALPIVRWKDSRARIMQIHSRKMNYKPLALHLSRRKVLPLSRPALHQVPMLRPRQRFFVLRKDDVNFVELARSTDDFNGAQLKVWRSCMSVCAASFRQARPSAGSVRRGRHGGLCGRIL